MRAYVILLFTNAALSSCAPWLIKKAPAQPPVAAQSTGMEISKGEYIYNGIVDFDPIYRYEFFAIGDLPYVRRGIHPNGGARYISVAKMDSNQRKFVEGLGKNPGDALPFGPPGPIASLSKYNLKDCKIESIQMYNWDSTKSFRVRLMSILTKVVESGTTVESIPFDVDSITRVASDLPKR